MPTSREGFRLDWLGEELKGATKKAAVDAVNRTLDSAVQMAQTLAPVDTGALKASIRKGPVTVAYNRISANFGGNTPYALFVELGTSRMAAQPHLRPAADRTFPGLAARLAQGIDRYAAKYSK